MLDFRQWNQFVECHTGDNVKNNRDKTLREWRQMSADVSIVDFKSAYLQLKIKRDLWKHQLVEYCLTRLEFSLNCSTRIISNILKSVVARNESIRKQTRSLITFINRTNYIISPVFNQPKKQNFKCLNSMLNTLKVCIW